MAKLKKLSSLKGRRALITGAAGNLGREIALTLAEMGADLVLVDKAEVEFSDQITNLSKQWDINVEYLKCDLERQLERKALIDQIKFNKAPLNIVINNAAFVGSSQLEGWAVPFEEQTLETWRSAIEVNLTAIFELCQGLSPLLRVAQGANIVNIASIYGMYGPDWSLYEGTSMGNPAAYSASKGGLIQLTRWMATSIAPNIRVNSISPGGIFRDQPESFVRKYIERTPLKRMASEDDFCGAIAFLASDLSSYITGHNLVVDGGWGAW